MGRLWRFAEFWRVVVELRVAMLAIAVTIVDFALVDDDVLARPRKVVLLHVHELGDLGDLPELPAAPFAGDAVGPVGPVLRGPFGSIVRRRW